jgi:hypothetical protein
MRMENEKEKKIEKVLVDDFLSVFVNIKLVWNYLNRLQNLQEICVFLFSSELWRNYWKEIQKFFAFWWSF